MKNREQPQLKRRAKTSKILLVIIFTVLLLSAGVLIVFTAKGKNIFEWASALPVVGSWFHSGDSIDYEKEIKELEAKLKNEQAKADQYKTQLENREEKIGELERKVAQLEAQLQGQENAGGETNGQWTQLVKTFEEMAPKQAAQILVAMEDDETVLRILADLKEKSLAAILEKMPAKDAARFSAKLANQTP